ncbi:DUF5934 domain-containing protein, partial [Ruegeria sp. HKCCD8929]|uniref:TraC family protein n=1 Tax=Ruegeria sp. HKCCD8929 TaxID=2683006 RepID=UPI001488BD6E
DLSATVSSITAYPPEWAFGLGLSLNGDAVRLMDRPIGPVLTSFTMQAMSVQKTSSFIVGRRGKNEHAESSNWSKFTPRFGEKKREFDNLDQEIQSGERLFETLYTVVAYGRGGPADGQIAASEMESIYRRQRIRMSKDTYLQLPLFLASLPFGCSSKMMVDFKRNQRMRLLKGSAAMAFMPLHGEWTGNSRGPGMLLLGRQGQVFQFDNFKSPENFNMTVTGTSGSGKSVFMQELAFGIVSTGGHVLIIDDGYSFKTTAEILGGKHIAFDGKTKNRLNPFSLLDANAMNNDAKDPKNEEYRASAILLITQVVVTMARLGDYRAGRVEEIEEEYIAEAITAVWDAKGPEGEITDVRDYLAERANTDERLPDIVLKLNAYSRGGMYGAYFEGPANIKLDDALTVVELSDIKGQRGLEAVVLQIVMFVGTELMHGTSRATRVGIVIDEAWDLLKGEGTPK